MTQYYQLTASVANKKTVRRKERSIRFKPVSLKYLRNPEISLHNYHRFFNPGLKSFKIRPFPVLTKVWKKRISKNLWKLPKYMRYKELKRPEARFFPHFELPRENRTQLNIFGFLNEFVYQPILTYRRITKVKDVFILTKYDLLDTNNIFNFTRKFVNFMTSSHFARSGSLFVTHLINKAEYFSRDLVERTDLKLFRKLGFYKFYFILGSSKIFSQNEMKFLQNFPIYRSTFNMQSPQLTMYKKSIQSLKYKQFYFLQIYEFLQNLPFSRFSKMYNLYSSKNSIFVSDKFISNFEIKEHKLLDKINNLNKIYAMKFSSQNFLYHIPKRHFSSNSSNDEGPYYSPVFPYFEVDVIIKLKPLPDFVYKELSDSMKKLLKANLLKNVIENKKLDLPVSYYADSIQRRIQVDLGNLILEREKETCKIRYPLKKFQKNFATDKLHLKYFGPSSGFFWNPKIKSMKDDLEAMTLRIDEQNYSSPFWTSVLDNIIDNLLAHLLKQYDKSFFDFSYLLDSLYQVHLVAQYLRDSDKDKE